MPYLFIYYVLNTYSYTEKYVIIICIHYTSHNLYFYKTGEYKKLIKILTYATQVKVNFNFFF